MRWKILVAVLALVAVAALAFTTLRKPSGEQKPPPPPTRAPAPKSIATLDVATTATSSAGAPSLELSIFGEDGKPIVGAEVRSPTRVLGTTDRSGKIFLSGASELDLIVTAPGRFYRGRHAIFGATRVTPGQTGSIIGSLEPPPARAGEGHVTMEPMVPGHPGAPIGPDGMFRINDIPAGVTRLFARGPGFAAQGPSVRIAPGGLVEGAVLRTEEAFALRGAATSNGDLGGAAISWATGARLPLAEDGSFEIHGLTTGNYALRLMLPAGDSWMTSSAGATSIRINDSDASVDLDIGEVHSLTATVVDEGARPVPGVALSYERRGLTGVTTVTRTTDARGQALFVGLAPEPIELRTSVPGSEVTKVSVPAPAVRIEVPPVGWLGGTLLDLDRLPVTGAMVILQPAPKGAPLILITDSGGTFMGPPLLAGKYLAHFAPRGTRSEDLERNPPDGGIAVTVAANATTRIDASLKSQRPVLKGTVLVDGKPATELTDVALYAEGTGGKAPAVARFRTKDGQFAFEAEPGQTYDVIASQHSGFWALAEDLSPSDDVRIELQPPGSIAVEVEPGGLVQLWDGNVLLAVAQDSNKTGSVRFEALAPGRYQVEGQDVTVKPGETTKLTSQPTRSDTSRRP